MDACKQDVKKCSLVSGCSLHSWQIGLTLNWLNFALLDCKVYVPVSNPALTSARLTSWTLLAHLSRRLTRWVYRMGLEPASVRACVRACVHTFKHETSRPITTKFYLKHHWGGGKAALGFGADQVRTLVSMATDSSHRVIMGKRASSRFLGCYWSDPFYTFR